MRILRKIWDIWLPIGQVIGDFIARLVLMLFYFTILLPFGLGVRLLSDRLDIKGDLPARWLEIAHKEPDLADARRLD